MLLDELLPAFDVRTQHVIRVDAPAGHVYASLWGTNFDRWGVTRTLYAIRALPALVVAPVNTWNDVRQQLRLHQFTLQDLLGHGFGLLAEQAGDELVIGTVGRFWRARATMRDNGARPSSNLLLRARRKRRGASRFANIRMVALNCGLRLACCAATPPPDRAFVPTGL